jgi:hypothetical protein
MRLLFSTISFLLFTLAVQAQSGTIKGKVVDQQSELPLIGAAIELINLDASTGAVTDIEGYFSLTNVPLGRHVIRVSYFGCESPILPNIEVGSSKEVILNIGWQESVNQMQEIDFTAESIEFLLSRSKISSFKNWIDL